MEGYQEEGLLEEVAVDCAQAHQVHPWAQELSALPLEEGAVLVE